MQNSLKKLKICIIDKLCKHRIVFHHVPKCGGNSVGKALPNRYLLSRRTISPFESLHAVDAVLNGHKRRNKKLDNYIFRQTLLVYLLLKDFHFIWGHVEFNENTYKIFKEKYLFVTSLRDPVERYISNYFYDRSYKVNNRLKIIKDLDDFTRTERGIRFGRRYCQYFSGLLPSSQFDEKAAVYQAKKNLHKFAVVGIIDNSEDFSKKMRKITGYKFKLGHKNKGTISRSEIDRTVHQEIRNRIREICEPDIEIYEYARQNF